MKFQDLGLAQPLLRAIEGEGYSVPTPIQAQAIPHVLEGRDLLGCAQTGTGKTAAFALPILHNLGDQRDRQGQKRRKIRVLVLAPTRELAAQIGASFATYGRHTGLRRAVIFGGVNQFSQVRELRQGVDILVATPGRLCDLMQQGHLDFQALEVLVLDEADRMFDMGFLPDVRHIIAHLPRDRQTLLFSATMPGPIEELANKILHEPERVRIQPQQLATELVDQTVCLVPKKLKTQLLADYLAEPAVTRAIVFTRTKHGADRLCRDLRTHGIQAEAIHGNKSQNARQRTLQSFKANRLHVLVATDLASRGIDVDGVSHVFNFELPHEPETYVHRIGRTGRAGANGIAVSFCDEAEWKLLKAIERLLKRAVPVAQDLRPARTARPEGAMARPASPQRQGQGSRDAYRGKRPRRRDAARSRRPVARAGT